MKTPAQYAAAYLPAWLPYCSKTPAAIWNGFPKSMNVHSLNPGTGSRSVPNQCTFRLHCPPLRRAQCRRGAHSISPGMGRASGKQ